MAPCVPVDLPPSTTSSVRRSSTIPVAVSHEAGKELFDLVNSLECQRKNTGEELARTYTGNDDETLAMPEVVVAKLEVDIVDGGVAEFIAADED
ncbi:hypothetical protein [Gimesia chilikensis]|uniref:Uncharacterized protein n=1 Tax=Gimesia chilikensis TaxID=2605989 RepID=A0A517PYW4_9PLAN|nr:hypothetical protein [Gimesia chilikensis]QDT24566.1 hypothetical protein HG66A1_64000 [Gimesia chilikensis]